MFRKMRRFKQQISDEKCIEILKTQPRGVLSVFGEDGYPYGMPLDHYYDEKSGKLYFHCAAEGHKLDAVRVDDRVSYCVMDEGYREDGDWPLHINSVIIFGRIRILDSEEEKVPALWGIGRKFAPDDAYVEKEIGKFLKNVLCLELIVDHMTGKLVKES